MQTKNLIYGKHSVDEFIKKHKNLVIQIWVTNTSVNVIKSTDLKIKKVSQSEIDALFDIKVNHQNIVAEVKEFNYKQFQEILNESSYEQKSIILMLDRIQDPFNFGAIIRTASLLNIKNIVILDHKQVFVTPTVVKTSSGTVYDVNISKVSNLNNAIKELKKMGYWVYSTNLNHNSQDMREVKFDNKSVIVIGNEHDGVSDLVTKNSDFNFYIPSNQNIDSYNANVAASIIMFYISSYLNKI